MKNIVDFLNKKNVLWTIFIVNIFMFFASMYVYFNRPASYSPVIFVEAGEPFVPRITSRRAEELALRRAVQINIIDGDVDTTLITRRDISANSQLVDQPMYRVYIYDTASRQGLLFIYVSAVTGELLQSATYLKIY